jgi:probable addiction module antidote protein
MPLKTTSFDVLAFLDSDEEQAGYLEAAMEEADPAFIAVVLGDIARARGVDRLAGEMGVSREVVEENFRDGGSPSIQLVFEAAKALGLKLRLVAA